MCLIFRITIISIFVSINTLCAQSLVKITTSDLNLRLRPDPNSNSIYIIPKGDLVNLFENCNCDWLKVNYYGYVGYVNSFFLKDYNYKIKTIHRGGESIRSSNFEFGNDRPTAICRDGTYSFSMHHRGTCSHHGGVARWLR
jgi:hypothetical protein